MSSNRKIIKEKIHLIAKKKNLKILTTIKVKKVQENTSLYYRVLKRKKSIYHRNSKPAKTFTSQKKKVMSGIAKIMKKKPNLELI